MGTNAKRYAIVFVGSTSTRDRSRAVFFYRKNDVRFIFIVCGGYITESVELTAYAEEPNKRFEDERTHVYVSTGREPF